MPNIQPKELQDLEQNLNMRINDKEVRMQLGNIYSRNNLARPTKTISAALVLNNKDAFVLCNTASAGFTVTLPPANSWGTNKSSIIYIHNIFNGSANLVTLAVSAGDTFTGSATTLAAGAMAICICNGNASWIASFAT